MMRSRPQKLLIPLQGFVAILGILMLAIWPPALGKLLIVPLASRDVNEAVKAAVAGGALVLGPGPVAGSLIVLGDRARVAAHIVSWRTIITAAPSAGCGNADGLKLPA